MSPIIVYRIAKKRSRSRDLSGAGAFNEGGRWNTPGTYALYTSESRALAALEILVHVDEAELPPNMFIMTIEISSTGPIYEVTDTELPEDWRMPENIALKEIGDKIFEENKFVAMKVRSAVMPEEYNYVLNPMYPGYNDFVGVVNLEDYDVDERLLG